MAEWVAVVAAVFFLTILVPGYMITRLLRLELPRRDLQLTMTYSIGIALVLVPVTLYWANYFGLPINLLAVAIVVSIVVSFPALAQIVILLRRKSPSRQSALDNEPTK